MPPDETTGAAGAPAAPAPAAAPAAAAPAPASAGIAPGAPAAAPIAAPAAGAPAGEQPGQAGEAAKTPEQIEADRVAAEAAAKAGEKPAGAPEKYEPFTPPEGGTLDQTVMDQFSEAARELNLPQDAAQKLVDKMAPIMAQRQVEQVQQVSAQWAAECVADKEFGGAQLEQSKVLAAKAMKQFATPEFTAMLNESGLGNHPELMRMMVKVGRTISEEAVVTGGVPASGNRIRTPAEVLYPASSLKT